MSTINKVAVVTGASRGLGRAIALSLGKTGCNVAVNFSKNKALAMNVCEEINHIANINNISIKAMPFQADVSDFDEVSKMFKEIVQTLGPVNILVNNAGITRDKLTISMTPNDFSSVININLNGTFYCTQAALKGSMLKMREGRIINISSVVGQIGNSGQANYAASKGGVIALTRAHAKEFAARNITVNAVCPGFIESDLTMNIGVVDREKILASIPLRRFGLDEEVAGLVRYLAIDKSAAYITGHCFSIDGGLGIGST